MGIFSQTICIGTINAAAVFKAETMGYHNQTRACGFGDLQFNMPKSIEANALLIDASNMFKDSQVDTLIVTENNKAIGMIDIQDLMKLDKF